MHNNGAGTAYPSGAPEFNSVFGGVRVTRSLEYGGDIHVIVFKYIRETIGRYDDL
jgi:hypothetical protein